MNYYLLMRFDGHAVTGMLVLDQPDPESARKEAIRYSNEVVSKLRKRYPKDEYRVVKRHIAFRRTLMKPWRKTRGEPILEIMELPQTVIYTNYWLGTTDNANHYCNIPRQREEHPMGYVCSRLSPEHCRL
jgi:hypothetical protein